MELMDAIRGRRSVRSYTDVRLTRAALEELLEAAVQAPSALNRQSWRFAVVEDPTEICHWGDSGRRGTQRRHTAFAAFRNADAPMCESCPSSFRHAAAAMRAATCVRRPWWHSEKRRGMMMETMSGSPVDVPWNRRAGRPGARNRQRGDFHDIDR